MKLSRVLKPDFFISTSVRIFLIRFFPSLAHTVVMILFSRKLDPYAYGLYQNFWVQLLVLSTIATAGIQSLLITYQKEFMYALLQRLNRIHYTAFFCWLLSMSTLFAMIQSGFPVLMAAAFLFFYAAGLIIEALLISYRKFRLLIGVNLAYTTLFILVHVLLVNYGFSLQQLFLYLMLLTLVKAIIGFATLRGEQPVIESAAPQQPAGSVRSLWLHLGIYDVLQILFKWIDKFILGFILTRELFAVYFNGSVDIPFLPLLLGAAGGAVLMQLAAKQDTANPHEVIKLMHASSRLLSCIVFPLFFFLAFYRYELFTVVFSERYLSAVPIFLAAVMVLPLRAYSFTTILQNRHKGSVINTGAVADLVLACAMMYPLYKLMGLPGIALSFVISTYLQAAFYLIATARLLQVGPASLIPWKNWLLKGISFGSLFMGLHYLTAWQLSKGGVLLLGLIAAGLATVISLWLELKAQR